MKRPPETNTPLEGEVMEIVYVSKITMASLGKPKAAASLDSGRNFVGRIGGTAVNTRKEMLPDGTESYSLTGAFVGIRDNGTIIRSGRLFLPQGPHQLIGETIRASEGPTALKFAYEVFTVPAKNPAGYSYELVDLMPPVHDEALELITKQRTAQIADQSELR